MFDLDAMRAYAALIEPLLFHVRHRVRERSDGQDANELKLCVMDEA